MTLTVLDLLDAARAHVAAFALPQLCSLTVTASTPTPHIRAQLADQDPAQLAAGLLGWAETLTEPAAEVWRVPDGDTVHLAVTGLLPGGASVRVYGGTPFPGCRAGAELAPDARSPLLLATLRAVAELGQVRS